MKRKLELASTYLPAVILLVALGYWLPRMLPGDVVTALYGNSHVVLSADDESALRSLFAGQESFRGYVKSLLTLDWGYSHALMAPVSDLVLAALPWTLLLMGTAHVLSMVLGVWAGVEAAWRRGSLLEKSSVGFMTVLEGTPEISTGVILLLVLALHLGWFPTAGAQTAYAQQTALQHFGDVLHHLTLPLVTLILAYTPGNFLLARAGMVGVLRSRFMETARAKGLPPLRVRYAHGARNALLPLVTRFGLRIAFMVTGALVVETIHSYPGLGTLLFRAIAMRDLPLIHAIMLLSAFMVLGVNLILELVYRRLDPRVRDGS